MESGGGVGFRVPGVLCGLGGGGTGFPFAFFGVYFAFFSVFVCLVVYMLIRSGVCFHFRVSSVGDVLLVSPLVLFLSYGVFWGSPLSLFSDSLG